MRSVYTNLVNSQIKIINPYSDTRLDNNACNQFSNKSPAVQTKKPLKRLKILVVEDIPTSQKVVRLLLEDLGYDVDIAENGNQALKLFKNRQYKAVLMDVGLPEIDGMTIAKMMRRQERGIKTPIIALTAYTKSEVENECLKAGMDEVATKPIIIDELNDILIRWCYRESDMIQNNTTQRPTVAQLYLNEVLTYFPHYTIHRIARESGIPRQTLIRIYKGINQNPQSKTFARLLQFYCQIMLKQKNAIISE